MERYPLPLLLGGLACTYLGERAFEATLGLSFSILGGLLMIGALVMALTRWQNTEGDRKRAYFRTLAEYILCLLGVAIYMVQKDDFGLVTAGKVKVITQVLWPAVLLLGLLPVIFMETALGAMRLSPRIEYWRVVLASRGARIVALAVIAFAGINYASNAWNRQVDLSYFKTTKPGTATLNIVENLAQPLDFYLFFPPGNQVAELASAYLEELEKKSEMVNVKIVDHALEPELAKELRVTRNGELAIKTEKLNRRHRLGLELEDAQDKLRDLDQEVQRMIQEVIKSDRVAYFTTGHMERDFSQPSSDKRLALKDLQTVLKGQGFATKRLGLGEGLGSEIPKDATVVIVGGAQEKFLPAELAAMRAYFEGGGSVLVLADPDKGVVDEELLSIFGVKVTEGLVATDDRRYRVLIRDQGETPYNLATTRASRHDSVKTIVDNAPRLGVVLLGAGMVERADDAPSSLDVKTTLRSMGQTWVDANGNAAFDKDAEKKRVVTFAAAIEHKAPAPPKAEEEQAGEKEAQAAPSPQAQGRAVVIGDADVAGDGLLRNAGNLYLTLDAVKWLAGDEASIGTVESEKDVKIVHKRDEDAKWFYGTSFAVPALVLGGGLFYTRRTRRGKKS